MGLYRDHVLPHLVDMTCGTKALDPWRARAAEGLSGRVVEIGFGSGRNVPHYPPEVHHVLAVEPSARARHLAEQRVARAGVPVEHIGLDGQQIPLDDATCDAALCTFTLCTVPDARRALAEVRRVLRPGGTFHFLEHGLSPDPAVARWQHRLDPLQRRLADGCHLTRDPMVLVEEAGFVLGYAEQRYARGPKPWSYMTLGMAANLPA
ncbi:MAG TPA: class I SAM-dependent methyltransferase [Acidimicrobiales bacterium]|nr:class I SAM-dependent methyltransferase [Acidimicrobiales bacterium]